LLHPQEYSYRFHFWIFPAKLGRFLPSLSVPRSVSRSLAAIGSFQNFVPSTVVAIFKSYLLVVDYFEREKVYSVRFD
jgi:uncharacterized protein (DUF2062 family)